MRENREGNRLISSPTELTEHNLITKISSKCITTRVDNRRSVSNWRLGVLILGSTLSLLCYSLMHTNYSFKLLNFIVDLIISFENTCM